MDLGYALLLLGGSHSACAHAARASGGGDRPAKRPEHEGPASSERERREPEAPSDPAPATLPGLGDPRAPDANPIDPRVF